MKKLKAWLKNHGYNNTKPVQFGNDYFYNTPAPHYEGIEICLSAANIRDIAPQEKQLIKYLSRYNYDIAFNTNIRYNYVTGEYNKFITVRAGADADASKNYDLFADPAKNECMELIHLYHEHGINKTHARLLNSELKQIMNKYESLYLQSLIKPVTA